MNANYNKSDMKPDETKTRNMPISISKSYRYSRGGGRGANGKRNHDNYPTPGQQRKNNHDMVEVKWLNLLVEVALQVLVGVVDQQLLQAVRVKLLETVDV